MVQPLCIRMLALHRGGLPNGNLGFPLDAKCGFLSVRISRVSVACSVCLLWAWERSPWQLLLVAFVIFKIRRLTCHCVITISAVLFKFGSKQRSVVDLPSMGIASTVALRPNGMSLAARSCWGSEFAKGLAGVFEPPVWGSRGLIGIGRLCSLCRSMCNHAPLIWKHWSATGPHFKRTVDQGQVSGEPKFDRMPLG